MFKRVFLAAILGGLLLAFTNCGDESTGPDNEDTVVEDSVLLSAIVHFDSTQTYIMKIHVVHESEATYSEIYLWWEQNFGEPFTDVNENGVYDPGIDEFYMSVTEDNQDLNHNGRYDGPDDPWEPEIPFDDIDGNDTCRQQDYYDDFHGGSNVPYYDANGNGIFDDSLTYQSQFVRFRLNAYQDEWNIGGLSDSLLFFHSDSGVSYFPQLRCYYCYLDEFEVTSTGLLYHSWMDLPPFTIFDDTIVRSDTGRVLLEHTYFGDMTVFRETSLDQTFELNGLTCSGLVKVRFDQIDRSMYEDSLLYVDASWEFYFSEEHGLTAISLKNCPPFLFYEITLEPFNDTFPIVLKK